MFKGSSTEDLFEKCLKQGLCAKHTASFQKDENNKIEDVELCRLALLYIRIGILNPYYFKRPAKYDKVQVILQKQNIIPQNFMVETLTEEDCNKLFILDSVIVFTACYFSKICCVGALFQSNVNSGSADAEVNLIEKLLYAESLTEADIGLFYPIILQNFDNCEISLSKLCYVSALIFIKYHCTKIDLKTAVESVVNDLSCNLEDKIYQKPEDYLNNGKKIIDAIKIYVNELKFVTPYNAELFYFRGQSHFMLTKYIAACFDFYIATILKPSCDIHALLYKEFCKHSGNIVIPYEMIRIAEFSCRWSVEKKCLCCHDKDNENGQGVSELFEKFMRLSSGLPKEETNSFPELIEASDSSDSDYENFTEAQDIPHLTDASDSEDSSVEADGFTGNQQRNDNTKSSKGKAKKSRSKTKKKIPEVVMQKETSAEPEDSSTINSYLKEASSALIQGCGYKALQFYCGKLRKVAESPEVYGFTETDAVCIKYAYGMAYFLSGGPSTDIQKGIDVFKLIIEKHDAVTFPAVYYALGSAYRKLNRFKDALEYLQIAESILDKGIQVKVCCWPGSSDVINQTKAAELKTLVSSLKQECENPPSPDAMCRLPQCPSQPSIFYSDPDFNGFVSIFCSEHCCLQYHFDCWKELKADKHLTDKDFLDKTCFTPDCDGLWIKIQFFDKKGDVSKQFLSEVKKDMKTKWAKWDKKPETKESKEKKKKKVDSSRSESLESEIVTSRKSSVCEDIPNPKLDSIQDALKNNLGDDYVLGNGQKEERPSSSCSSTSELSSSSGKKIIKSSLSPEIISALGKNLYMYMNDFLQLHGPLKIDDPLLMNVLSSFPVETLALVSEYGGIGKFLEKDLRFAFVGDCYVCVTADLAKAYKLYSSLSLPPEVGNLESMSSVKSFNGSGDGSLRNYSLNPDACEYKPSSQSDLVSDEDRDVRKIRLNTVLTDGKFFAKDGEFSISAFGVGNPMQNGSKTELAMTAEDLGAKLQELLDLYFSEGMDKQRPVVDSFIKAYSIREAGDMKRIEEEKQEMLKMMKDLQVRNEVLVEQKNLLQSHLNKIRVENSDLIQNINVLKLQIASLSKEVKDQTKALASQEQTQQETERLILGNLSKSYDTCEKQKVEIESLRSEIKSLERNLNDLKTQLQSSEDKLKNASKVETEHSLQLKSVQEENTRLKNKLQQTDLKILYLQKTEYIKKIEDKHAEAMRNRESLNSMVGNLNPLMHANAVQLDKHLADYIDQLTAIKLDFAFKIDDQIERVKNGAFLMELKEIEILDLPRVPTFESLGLLPTRPGSAVISNQLATNFSYKPNVSNPPGLLTPPLVPPVPAASPFAFAAASNTMPVPNLPVANFNSGKDFASKKIPDLDPIDKPKASTITPDSSHLGASSSEAVSKNNIPRQSPATCAVVESSKAPETEVKAAASKNNYEKLLKKLHESYPLYSQEELISFIKEFRARRQGKLTGLPIDVIISQVGEIINSKIAASRKPSAAELKNQPCRVSRAVVNKSCVSEPKQPEKPAVKKPAWNVSQASQKPWSGNHDTSCVICYEDMTRNAYTVACGHAFHEKCIKKWLEKKSDCPICRVLLLLPEEYPSLS